MCLFPSFFPFLHCDFYGKLPPPPLVLIIKVYQKQWQRFVFLCWEILEVGLIKKLLSDNCSQIFMSELPGRALKTHGNCYPQKLSCRKRSFKFCFSVFRGGRCPSLMDQWKHSSLWFGFWQLNPPWFGFSPLPGLWGVFSAPQQLCTKTRQHCNLCNNFFYRKKYFSHLNSYKLEAPGWTDHWFDFLPHFLSLRWGHIFHLSFLYRVYHILMFYYSSSLSGIGRIKSQSRCSALEMEASAFPLINVTFLFFSYSSKYSYYTHFPGTDSLTCFHAAPNLF